MLWVLRTCHAQRHWWYAVVEESDGEVMFLFRTLSARGAANVRWSCSFADAAAIVWGERISFGSCGAFGWVHLVT